MMCFSLSAVPPGAFEIEKLDDENKRIINKAGY